MSNVTKEQANAFGLSALLTIGGIATIAAVAQSVPVWVSILIASPFAGFAIFYAIRFIKRTWFSSKFEDGGSSTH